MDGTRRRDLLTLLGLSTATVGSGILFIDWPLNRDVTWYATIARELRLGSLLYVDVWDIKPPAIHVTFMLSQSLIPSEAPQIFILDLLPTLVVLTAVVYCARAAGFGWRSGVWSGLFWVAFSNDTLFQAQEPNTEIFINACSSIAFLQFLRLRPNDKTARPLSIGFLFGLACLYKTVAIATAIGLGLTHLLATEAGGRFAERLRQLLLMAAAGTLSLAAVIGYFWITGRFGVFWEAMVDLGPSYAGDIWSNVFAGITFAPIVGENPLLNVLLAVAPWVLMGAIAMLDRERSRSWALLSAYAFGSLIAVALPGRFYAHYFQLLLPPLCLGLGWLVGAGESLRWPHLRRAMPVLAGVLLAGVFFQELRVYRSSPAEAVAGTYQELYLETQSLGRRLGSALAADEVLYQWGEESGLYWYSGKRPPAAVLTFGLLSGPQAERLTSQTLQSLSAKPPDLIVAVNYILDSGAGHPVFAWIQSNYTAVRPEMPGERRFFTFYLPNGASTEFTLRALGSAPPEG